MPLRNKDRTGEHTHGTFLGSAALIATLLAGAYCTPANAGAHLTQFTVDPGPAPKAAPTGPLPLSTKSALTIPSGSEFCGLDSIFPNGFEVATWGLLTQLSGGIASPGLTQDIVGTGSPSVAITPPVPGTTGETTVDVSGTFVGPVNTGVVVNGVSGYTVNGLFLVPNVPLVAGSNPLNVTTTTLPGATATNSGSISQSGTASTVVIQVNHPTGYAPVPLTFTFSIGALPSGFPVQSVAINFKGTGTPDFTGTSLSGAPSVYTYKVPGLYAASLAVTDTHANVYTAYRSVLIQDLAAQRGMLCDVYGYLKSKLSGPSPSASAAALAFQPVVQNQYLAMFNAFGTTNMPTVAQQLGLIVSGFLGQGFAEFFLVRDNSGAQTRAGFPLRMTQGADGVWRISEI